MPTVCIVSIITRDQFIILLRVGNNVTNGFNSKSCLTFFNCLATVHTCKIMSLDIFTGKLFLEKCNKKNRTKTVYHLKGR